MFQPIGKVPFKSLPARQRIIESIRDRKHSLSSYTRLEGSFINVAEELIGPGREKSYQAFSLARRIPIILLPIDRNCATFSVNSDQIGLTIQKLFFDCGV